MKNFHNSHSWFPPAKNQKQPKPVFREKKQPKKAPSGPGWNSHS